MVEDWKKYFDPQVLRKLDGLALLPRRSAEGALAGRHRSRSSGQAIEFAEHRPYTLGDDLRQVDWKIYGRTDKIYLRQREDETTLACHLMVDTTRSMLFRGDAASLSKLDYALHCAAALGYLVIDRQDQVSLTTLGAGATRRMPLASGRGQLLALGEALQRIEPQEDHDLGSALAEAASGLGRRGLAVVLSDLLEDPDAVLSGVRRLRHAGHEVILIHILDPAEKELPFDAVTAFVGLEGEPELVADPRGVRSAYREEVQQFLRTLQAGCHATDTTYWSVTTDQPLQAWLPARIAARQGR